MKWGGRVLYRYQKKTHRIVTSSCFTDSNHLEVVVCFHASWRWSLITNTPKVSEKCKKPTLSIQSQVQRLPSSSIGGFNPFENYWSNWKSSPSRGPIKNIWNHHLVLLNMLSELCCDVIFCCQIPLNFQTHLQIHPTRSPWKCPPGPTGPAVWHLPSHFEVNL